MRCASFDSPPQQINFKRFTKRMLFAASSTPPFSSYPHSYPHIHNQRVSLTTPPSQPPFAFLGQTSAKTPACMCQFYFYEWQWEEAILLWLNSCWCQPDKLLPAVYILQPPLSCKFSDALTHWYVDHQLFFLCLAFQFCL